MRAVLDIDDQLLRRARDCTGIDRQTDLVTAGLKALVQQEAARSLAAMGGGDPAAREGGRRRSAGTLPSPGDSDVPPLDELLSQVDPTSQPELVDWGHPVGKEVW